MEHNSSKCLYISLSNHPHILHTVHEWRNFLSVILMRSENVSEPVLYMWTSNNSEGPELSILFHHDDNTLNIREGRCFTVHNDAQIEFLILQGNQEPTGLSEDFKVASCALLWSCLLMSLLLAQPLCGTVRQLQWLNNILCPNFSIPFFVFVEGGGEVVKLD